MHRDRRRDDYTERVLRNFSDIQQLVDDIQADLREISRHTLIHDKFFMSGYPIIKSPSLSESIPTEELVDIYMDTCTYISQLSRALEALQQVKRLTHMYDYSSNPKFEEIVNQMLKEA